MIKNDRRLTKSYLYDNIMIEKKKKHIIKKAAISTLDLSREDIERYLLEVREAVQKGCYRIARNKNRADNIDLFLHYVIDENRVREILLSLTVEDFSARLNNEHPGFAHEKLYVFGKDVRLLERFGEKERTVFLYIKLNKLENCYVIVISFHEQKHLLTYPFK